MAAGGSYLTDRPRQREVPDQVIPADVGERPQPLQLILRKHPRTPGVDPGRGERVKGVARALGCPELGGDLADVLLPEIWCIRSPGRASEYA